MRTYVRSHLVVASLLTTIAGCGSGTDSGLSSDEGGSTSGFDAGSAPSADSGLETGTMWLDTGASTSADSGLEESSTPGIDAGPSIGAEASAEVDSTTGLDSGVIDASMGADSGVDATTGADTGVRADSGVDASTVADTGADATSQCGVSPVSPDATQQTKNLLCYLYSIKGNHVLSGQQEANWNANPTDIAWYTSNGLEMQRRFSEAIFSTATTPLQCAAVARLASTTRAILPLTGTWAAITMFRYAYLLACQGRASPARPIATWAPIVPSPPPHPPRPSSPTS